MIHSLFLDVPQALRHRGHYDMGSNVNNIRKRKVGASSFEGGVNKGGEMPKE
jgi:hypothetical protein